MIEDDSNRRSGTRQRGRAAGRPQEDGAHGHEATGAPREVARTVDHESTERHDGGGTRDPRDTRCAELARKYDELVAKFRRLADSRAGAHDLAHWALEATHVGAALLSIDHAHTGNARWSELNAVDSAWCRVATDGAEPDGAPPVMVPLRQLALEEARALAASRRSQTRTVWCRREGDPRIYTCRVTRVRPRSLRATTGRAGGSTATSVGPLFVALVEDATDRAKAEELMTATRRLAERSKELHGFVERTGGAVHDLQGSLVALRLRLDLLAGGQNADGAAHLEAAQTIVRDGLALLERVASDTRAAYPAPAVCARLGPVLESALERLRPQLGQRAHEGRPIRLETEIGAVPSVAGDETELRLAIGNLLANACDAMPHGGCLCVRAYREGDRVLVRVEDTGVGIPSELLPRLFQPFVSTKGSRGTGLGLATVWSVMARLGGSVRAENRARRGARFTLELPVADEERARDAGG